MRPRPAAAAPLHLSDYDYAYPRELVARYPAEPRDSARLMVVDRATGTIAHRVFRDLPEYFEAGDVLVVNDTKVYPARLFGTKEHEGGARLEIFLLRELSRPDRLWDVLVQPARKVRVGSRIVFDAALSADVVDTTPAGGRVLRFRFDGTDDELTAYLDRIGSTPLPPYLRRTADEGDRERYQTVFAAKRGAVAAPTAGLHFTPDLLGRLDAAGVHRAPVTLHVGLGTFRSVEREDVTAHEMDEEYYEVSDETAAIVNRALTERTGTVTAIGTTSVRTLESSVTDDGQLRAGSGWTRTFIVPPYDFRIVQRLVTNFHMPKTTLLLLVAAFAGYDLMREAYRVAIEQEYRLFSYGDAMLIL